MSAPDEPLVLSVQYQLVNADLIDYFRHRRWGEPKGRRHVLLLWLVLVAVAITPVALAPDAIAGIGLAGAAILLLMLAASGMLLIWLAAWVLPWGLARSARKQSQALAPSTLTVAPDGLFGTTEGQEFRHDWGGVEDIVTTREHLFFYFGGENALAVPRRAFGSPAEAEKFYAVAREYRSAFQAVPPRATPAVELADALGPERVAIEYELTDEDVRRFQRCHIFRNPKTLPTMAVQVLLIAVFVGAISRPIIGVASAIGSIVVPLWVMPWVARRQLRKQRGALGRHTVVISPAALWLSTPGLGEGRVEWSAIKEVVANEHLVLLYRDEQIAHVVPRRAFATPREAETFLLRATEWLAAAGAGAASRVAADKMG
ncbi:MAG TPA: YcxB family protein [Armatimonadota bacterium]|nr:YcxB family protein [Armatimonadota bacterium]